VAALGLGGCLADDMGLGKTVQLIALLCELRESGPARTLLVVPTSLLGNWTSELERFAPQLAVEVLHPSAAAKNATPDAEVLERSDVVLTTYGLVHRQAMLQAVRWRLVALDEA